MYQQRYSGGKKKRIPLIVLANMAWYAKKAAAKWMDAALVSGGIYLLQL